MKYTNENGRSMVEMLGVLAIIGVLSVGGIAGYSKAMNKFKINKTTDQVSMLIANLRTIFSAQGDYAGLGNEQAVKFGVVPDEMYSTCTTGNCKITNAFGGAVKIAASALRDASAATDKGAFLVSYDGLSQEACVTLATGDWGSNEASGLVAVMASGAGVEAAATAMDAVTLTSTIAANSPVARPGDTNSPAPMAVANAVTGCGSAAENASANGTVTWKYY